MVKKKKKTYSKQQLAAGENSLNPNSAQIRQPPIDMVVNTHTAHWKGLLPADITSAVWINIVLALLELQNVVGCVRAMVRSFVRYFHSYHVLSQKQKFLEGGPHVLNNVRRFHRNH